MNYGKLLNDPVKLALGAIIVIGFVYLLARKTFSDVKESVLNVNKGTPYEGFGAVGTVGHGVNIITGGATAAIGSRIADWFIPDARSSEVHYTFTLPDGSRGAVSSLDVDPAGYFFRNGIRYRLAWDQNRKRIAVAA